MYQQSWYGTAVLQAVLPRRIGDQMDQMAS
jgi:hypothetical protein